MSEMETTPRSQPLRSFLLALVATAGVAAALLAYDIRIVDQTILPKRIGASLGAAALFLALAFCGKLKNPQIPRSSAWFLCVFGGFFGARVVFWPWARDPGEVIEPLLDHGLALVWAFGLAIWMGRSSSSPLRIGLMICTALVSAVGLVQFASVQPEAFPFGTGAGKWLLNHLQSVLSMVGLDRISQTDVPGSVFGHANFSAEVVAALVPMALASAWSAWASSQSNGRRILTVFFALSVAAMGAIFLARASSRAGAIALVAGVCVLVFFGISSRARRAPWFGSRRRHLAAAGLLLLGSAAGLSAVATQIEIQPRHGQIKTSLARRLASSVDSKNTTIRERLDLWGNTLEMIKARPVLGVGPGGFAAAYPEWSDARRRHELGRLTQRRQPGHPHNELLDLLAEDGLVVGALGILVWLFACVIAWRALTGSLRLPTSSAAHVYGAFATLVAIGLFCLVSFPLERMPTRLIALIAVLQLAQSLPERRSSSRAIPLILVLVVVVLSGAALRLRAEWSASRDLGRAVTLARVPAEADIAVRRGRQLASLQLLDAAALRLPDDASIALTRTLLLERVGKRGEALSGARRLVAERPHLINAWTQLASLELAGGRITLARKAATEALRLNRDDPSGHIALAKIDARAGFAKRSRTSFLRALSLKPVASQRREIYAALAVSFAREGEAVTALRCLGEAEVLDAANLATMRARARVFEWSASGSIGAFEAWSDLAERDPADAEAALRVGVGQLVRSQDVEALASLDRAHRLDPRNPAVSFHRARALARLGRPREALALTVECVRLTGRPGGDVVLFRRCLELATVLQSTLQNPPR